MALIGIFTMFNCMKVKRINGVSRAHRWYQYVACEEVFPLIFSFSFSNWKRFHLFGVQILIWLQFRWFSRLFSLMLHFFTRMNWTHTQPRHVSSSLFWVKQILWYLKWTWCDVWFRADGLTCTFRIRYEFTFSLSLYYSVSVSCVSISYKRHSLTDTAIW